MDRQALQDRFGILGDSPALRLVIERVRQVAPSDITVLLEGESGVGKELVATAVHGLSARRHKRFVVVNCGAIPEGLIESELFGAEKGAYTGSVERRTGYFEEADGGTIFLDEIGETPLQAQVRLLRVLETGQFNRVGSSTTLSSDARVVAATNKDLGAEVAAGRFREDLYYRLSAITLRIPPLRERKPDIVPLFETFLRRFALQYDAPPLQLTPGAAELLTQYAWPGNVRELRNAAEQTVVLVRQSPVSAEALRSFLRGVSAGSGVALARGQPVGGDEVRERELIYRALLEMRMELREIRGLLGSGASRDAASAPPSLLSAPSSFGPPRFGPSGFGPSGFGPAGGGFEDGLEPEVAYEPPDTYEPVEASDTPFEIEERPSPAWAPEPPASLDAALAGGLPLPTMADAEESLIREALRRFDGNRRQTADALGISERTLYRKIKEFDGD